jgi:hypothetical protein
MIAGQARHDSLVKRLKKLGARDDLFYESAGERLFEVVRAGLTAEVERLLASNRHLANCRDRSGGTPLHAAAVHRQAEIVEKLLAAGALANACTTDGVTPLHIAVRRGAHAVASALLAGGANANATDRNGFTPLDYAASSRDRKGAAPGEVRNVVVHLEASGGQLAKATREELVKSLAEVDTVPKAGGCFVVTALFESENAPEVIVLRAWREAVLRPHSMGRAMIAAYDVIGPRLARIAQVPIFPTGACRAIVRAFCQRLTR